MSRLPTPSSRLPVAGNSRLPAMGVRQTPATAAPTGAKRPATQTAGGAGKRTCLETTNDSSSVSGRPPAPSRMRPPTVPTLTRSKSVLTLCTPAGRPASARTVSRAGPMRDVTVQVASRVNKMASGSAAGTGAAKATSKRQPWDLKGRLQDMERHMSEKSSQHDEVMQQLLLTQERVSRMEAEKKILEVGVKQEVVRTVEMQSEVERLRSDLRQAEDQSAEQRRQLNSQLSDLQAQLSTSEAAKAALERQIRSLEAELRCKTDEAAALMTSVGQLTAAQATVAAQLTAAQLAVRQLTAERQELEAQLAQRDATVVELEAKSSADETLRRRLHNQVQELKGNIRVFCRVRPLLGEEIPFAAGSIQHIQFIDEHSMEVGKTETDDRRETMSGRRREEGDGKTTFTFDRVFPPNSEQAQVFDEISQLIQSALDGYNVCVFAYGQTGSGKTYTMEGGFDGDSEGVIPRAVRQIFESCDALTEKGWTYSLEASFLEIYNETIRDLLHVGKGKLAYDIRMVESKASTKNKEVYVTNLKVVPVSSQAAVAELLDQARRARAVAATNCNQHSSRSHSVFTLRLTGHNRLTSESCQGSLNLVDLAGSERLKESGSQGDRLTETKSINKSLANLGNVIMALAGKQEHVPYRNSKLTHLLQHSLGGNSKTLMFVNVSPREDFLSETLNSLRFAAKVNQCHIGTASKRVK